MEGRANIMNLKKIQYEKKREKLNKLYQSHKDINSPEMLKLSRSIDKLVNKYEIKKKKSR